MTKPAIVKIISHPALLFEVGNVALAIGYAETVAIVVNILLVVAILIARWTTVVRKKPYDISFIILACVNFFTGLSVLYKATIIDDGLTVGSTLAALTYIFWAIGHFYAGRLQNKNKKAQTALKNPQFHYGIGDMLVVNVQGTLNVFSFPFTVAGFIKSVLTGRKKTIRKRVIRQLYMQVSSARLYAAGFIVGAVSTYDVLHLAVAQVLWALAYLHFGKDTE